jgi:hypothetical protein
MEGGDTDWVAALALTALKVAAVITATTTR